MLRLYFCFVWLSASSGTCVLPDARTHAFFANWADEEREVELSLKKGTLAGAKNAETGGDVALLSGKARLRLARHDLAIVELK